MTHLKLLAKVIIDGFSIRTELTGKEAFIFTFSDSLETS